MHSYIEYKEQRRRGWLSETRECREPMQVSPDILTSNLRNDSDPTDLFKQKQISNIGQKMYQSVSTNPTCQNGSFRIAVRPNPANFYNPSPGTHCMSTNPVQYWNNAMAHNNGLASVQKWQTPMSNSSKMGNDVKNYTMGAHNSFSDRSQLPEISFSQNTLFVQGLYDGRSNSEQGLNESGIVANLVKASYGLTETPPPEPYMDSIAECKRIEGDCSDEFAATTTNDSLLEKLASIVDECENIAAKSPFSQIEDAPRLLTPPKETTTQSRIDIAKRGRRKYPYQNPTQSKRRKVDKLATQPCNAPPLDHHLRQELGQSVNRGSFIDTSLFPEKPVIISNLLLPPCHLLNSEQETYENIYCTPPQSPCDPSIPYLQLQLKLPQAGSKITVQSRSQSCLVNYRVQEPVFNDFTDGAYVDAGRSYKRAADMEMDPIIKLCKYLDSIINYLMAAEVKERNEKSHESAYDMYINILAMVKYLLDLNRPLKVPHSRVDTFGKLIILYMRCQSIISIKALRLRNTECEEVTFLGQRHLESGIERLTPDMRRIFSRQNYFLLLFSTSYKAWIEADRLQDQRGHNPFFKAINGGCSTLRLTSSIRDLALYLVDALILIRREQN